MLDFILFCILTLKYCLPFTIYSHSRHASDRKLIYTGDSSLKSASNRGLNMDRTPIWSGLTPKGNQDHRRLSGDGDML